tara:strand:- start:1366 stop:1632 length:267 start_codon:yes stop_codon:yes gene_type:complete
MKLVGAMTLAIQIWQSGAMRGMETFGTQRSRQTVTELWEWMERPKWYRRGEEIHWRVPEMTPEERTEWVKSLKRSHDESVRSPREEEG